MNRVPRGIGSVRRLTVTNPHLVELVAMLEGRKDADIHHALEFVKRMVEWKEER